jgi:hypothetical protein
MIDGLYWTTYATENFQEKTLQKVFAGIADIPLQQVIVTYRKHCRIPTRKLLIIKVLPYQVVPHQRLLCY